MKICTPNLGILELHISYRCNLRCNNCSNLCTQAPATFDLTVEDIKKLLADSLACGRKWGMITIHGGEPTVHPQYYQICETLLAYKKEHNPDMVLWFLTNYSTDIIKERANKIKELGIPLGLAPKKDKNQNPNGSWIPYVPVNESPIDLGAEFTLGCFQTETCGIAYNYLGFFECSPAASAARVFGYDSPVKEVKDLTAEKLSACFPEHCKHCGFAMPDRRRVTEQVTTATWEKKLGEYNGKI